MFEKSGRDIVETQSLNVTWYGKIDGMERWHQVSFERRLLFVVRGTRVYNMLFVRNQSCLLGDHEPEHRHIDMFFSPEAMNAGNYMYCCLCTLHREHRERHIRIRNAKLLRTNIFVVSPGINTRTYPSFSRSSEAVCRPVERFHGQRRLWAESGGGSRMIWYHPALVYVAPEA